MLKSFVVSWDETKTIRTAIDAQDKDDAINQFKDLHPNIIDFQIIKGNLKEYRK